MIINEREYKVPPITFNSICELERAGVDFSDMDGKSLSTLRGFLAFAMGTDPVSAGQELEEHLSNGGDLGQIVEEIAEAVNNCGFFHSMSRA